MSEETLAWGFPDTGAAVLRASLVDVLSARPETVKILAAPSGYGKTVVAAQFALSAGFRRAVWVDVGQNTSAEPRLLASVVSALRHALGPQAPERVPDGAVDLSDLVALLSAAAAEGARVCVVLDDVQVAGMLSAPSQLNSIENALASVRGSLVVTTRDVCTIEGLERAQYLDAEDLRLTLGEALEICRRIQGTMQSPELVEEVWRTSGGHAAIFAVLASDLRLVPDAPGKGRHSLDLDGLLNRVVRAHLDPEDQRTLAAMGMLGAGTASQLQAVGVDPAASIRIARVLPLVTVATDDDMSFRVHDILQSWVLSLESTSSYKQEVAPRVVEQLLRRGEMQKALDLVSKLYEGGDLTSWLELHGADALAAGCRPALRRLMSTLSLRELIERPRLLLLQTSLLSAMGALEEAATKARVVATMAAGAGDRRLAADAMRLTAAIQNESGQMAASGQTLLDLVATYGDIMSPEEKAHTYASLGCVRMYEGDVAETQSWMRRAEEVLKEHGLTGTAASAALASEGACVAMVSGLYSETARFFSGVASARGLELRARAAALGNAAASLCEVGRLDRCLESCQQALQYCGQLSVLELEMNFRPIISAARVGLGDVTALKDMSEVVSGDRDYPFMSGRDHNRIYYATSLRACGFADEALSQAERAFEGLHMDGLALLSSLAQLEVGASMLALGDVTSARHLTNAALAEIDPLNYYHQLRAAMIFAQIDMLAGDLEGATDRIRPYRDYILTGSSNWQSAMYVRAFPELIAALAMAIGVEDVPVRMLRMVLPENAERSLAATREVMPQSEWRALGKRLLGADEFEKWIEREGKPLCRVKMFGGFEVSIGSRQITEKDWKKRKARALFMILASRNGHAITRDQLCDRLWPDMDDERAKNNLYVAWSVMKSALLGPEGKGEECPYIEAVGGLCHTVADVVRTDVDEFDRLVAEAKVAETSGNKAAAIMAHERLADLYRGELLPGDIYDDSFQAMRDRYRHEFCDAMLRGSDLALSVDDAATALQFARRGLGSDPFREDLYQSALRAQIRAGQRSAAIETYFECRSKLIDELGLDPSGETRALYDQVLALEERPMQPHTWGTWLPGDDSASDGAAEGIERT